MEAGNIVAFAAVVVTGISVGTNYVMALRRLDHERALADRDVAGNLLVSAGTELHEAAVALNAIQLSLESYGHRAFENPLGDKGFTMVNEAYGKLSARADQLLIRFGSGEVASSFRRATEAVQTVLGAAGAIVVAAGQPPEGQDEGSQVLARVTSEHGSKLEGPRADFDAAQEAFRQAAFEMVGVKNGPPSER